MIKKYTKEIEEIKNQDWIHKIYKENIDGVVGYFIQFLDESFIVGNIKKNRFEYTYIRKNSYIGATETSAELFAKYVEVRFDGEKAKDSFMTAIHKEFNSDIEKNVDDMTKAELEAEMLMSAKHEDFERAAMLKKKLEER